MDNQSKILTNEDILATSIYPVYLLIDWHNATGYISPKFSKNPRKELPEALLKIQQQVANLLSSHDATQKYRVTMRIYHGWHRERAPMPIYRDFEQYSHNSDLARRFSKVSFVGGFQFGNIPVIFENELSLYSTYRPQGQKMIDTGIVCDMLELLRTDAAKVAIILSDDDDFVPAVLMATAWKKQSFLLRKSGSNISHITDFDEKSILRYWS